MVPRGLSGVAQMNHMLMLMAACGAAGAAIYSFPLYIKAISKVPPTAYAFPNMIFSIVVGTICAVVFTRVIGYNFPWTVDPEPWPLALIVGLGSNPLVPILVRKLEKWASAFEGKAR